MGAVCCFATTVTMEQHKSSDSSELRPHTVQGTNANHAKLEDSAQLAQVIVLVNELSGDLVVILLEEPFCWRHLSITYFLTMEDKSKD